MSLEAKIEDLTQVMRELVIALTRSTASVTTVAVKDLTLESPVVVSAAPVAAAPAPVAAAPAMPAPPVFTAPAPVAAPAAPAAPFADAKGLMDYVMNSYKTLGPVKGAHIQGVLTGLGYQTINDVKPEHYGALFAGVEALKV